MADIQPIHTATNSLKLTRLLQLCSAGLPVGGYSFSQGLEYAVELAWVKNVESAKDWIQLNLLHALAQTDLPVLHAQIACLAADDFVELKRLNQLIIACRESAELRMADLAMGKALIRLLKQQNIEFGEALAEVDNWSEISFVSAFALAAYCWQIDAESAATGFCWAFIENQVAAGTKLIPLGQTQAQNLMFELSEWVEQATLIAKQTDIDEVGASLPALAMASAWHETQYSRLFRS
ncbi:urease accessory protein UreF [Catenovulum sediminis]|uniref:urease accessory protein UreF n=1 Tax=Catenovulum sediminis TaxID=1740262 RepID=UPI00117E3122|nr:urease accessory protein UreF [Catenovulum sediminis]